MGSFLRYVLVGGAALGLHLAILKILVLVAYPAWLASAAGFVLACVFNYSLQSVWVFRSAQAHAVALSRYIAITTIMLGVNTGLFAVLYQAGIPALTAQSVTTGGVFLLNFLANRRFTFSAARTVSP